MTRIAEYQILYSPSPITLSAKVNEKIAEGWQPYGSMSSSIKGSSTVHCQPVVRTAEAKQALSTTI